MNFKIENVFSAFFFCISALFLINFEIVRAFSAFFFAFLHFFSFFLHFCFCLNFEVDGAKKGLGVYKVRYAVFSVLAPIRSTKNSTSHLKLQFALFTWLVKNIKICKKTRKNRLLYSNVFCLFLESQLLKRGVFFVFGLKYVLYSIVYTVYVSI